MEKWQDQGIVLEVRSHGENGAIVSLLTATRGRYAGYVHGAHSTKMRGTLEVGNLVDVNWSSRLAESLGTFSLELSRNHAARLMHDALRLGGLQSACALCAAALPEREGHPGLFQGLLALFDVLDGDVWGAAYVLWEIALLKELGFSLDLTRCAGGGDAEDLAYVSPKTGRAVSRLAGAPYKEKLLNLPPFLRPQGGAVDDEAVLTGLLMTSYFLEHWVFIHHTQGIPEARSRFRLRFESRFVKQEDQRRLEAPSGAEQEMDRSIYAAG
ncbi:MAG: DNA repair protein RecO [Alphaproteobacteria bacterium]|nr:DNA repair protein RecO [Alphaproteobacteria bacterium]